MNDVKYEKVPAGIFDKVENNKEVFIEKFIDELEELFPDTVKDGKVDFQALLERFGEYEDRDERYELTWVGKSKARKEAFEDIVGKTLKYIEKDSVNPEKTENLYIEGDNLEVLKLLRNSYYGKIKMIYIDPPYNTGSDFVYKDDFAITKEEYDELKGDLDENGNRLVKNSSDSGRYHSNWLNMMYPRLQVAKDLLAEDGVIFISIDDNESHNMKKICDEIFAEKNFIGEIIRKTKSTTNDAGNGLNIQHDSCLIYGSSKINVVLKGEEKTFDNYTNPDNDPRGNWVASDPTAIDDGRKTKNLMEIKNPYTGKIDVPGKGRRWRFNKEGYNRLVSEKRLVFKKEHRSNQRGFVLKRYQDEINARYNLVPTLFINNKFMNQAATKEVKNLLGGKYFDFPKPVVYVKKLVKYATEKDSIILDFFSGSATTAHAVMSLNADDKGDRKFIMVQYPESTDEKSAAYKQGYKNICEIGKERIKLAADKILKDNKDKEGIDNLDTGFKVFRVEDTNLRRINEIEKNDLESNYKSLSKKDQQDFNRHFTDLDVVYELMLRRQDIKLTEEIKKLENIGERTYIVGDTILVCLEENITEEIVEKIGNINTDLSWIVLRDSAFENDCDLKINTTNKLRSIIKINREKEQKIYWI